MTFGTKGQVNYDDAVQQLQVFVQQSDSLGFPKAIVDTARMYNSGNGKPEEDAESVIGRVLKDHPELRAKVELHTKVNPVMAPHRALTRACVLEQFETSLK